MLTRGSKSAAEKVVRESEGGPDMGSPDRRESIPPVADMQDSPLFKFLCELSPIQPAKSVHHAQTYNELTFPQEHRVFASPRSASRRASTSALKRCVAAELVSAQAQAEGRESLGWHQGGAMSRSTVCGSPSPLNRRSDDHQVTPCSRRQGEEAGASQCMDAKMEAAGDDADVGERAGGEGKGAMSSGEPNAGCTSREMDGAGGSGGRVETKLADYAQLESRVSAGVASETVRCSDGNGKGGRVGGARSEVSDAGERRQSTSSLVSHVIDCVVAGDPSEGSRWAEGEEQRRMSMGCSSGIEGHGLTFSPAAKGSPELDRETTAMAYFLAGNQDLGHGNEEWSEDSSEVVVPRLAGYCGKEGDGKDERAGWGEGEMVDAITPQSGLGTCSEEGHDAGMVITAQNVGQQQALLSNRGDGGGQRGFRRRCLDFDASVARRKSLGSIGGRKGVGSRLRDCSGSSAGDGGIAGGKVGDVVAATPDGSSGRAQARGSGFAKSDDSSRTESDSGTHARGASTCGDSSGGMTRMQFTRGPFQKSAGVPNAKGVEAQTPTSQNCGAAGAVVPAGGLRRSPRVRPTGIGLHLNSLTSAVASKREYPSGGGESSKGVLATVLGLQPVACASAKENPCGEGRLGSAGYGGGAGQSFNPGVGSVVERRGEMEASGVDGASVMNNRVSIPAPDFRCLNLESLSALEESLSLTPGASVLRAAGPRGQKRSQGHQEELMRTAQAEGEGEAMDDIILESPQSSKRRRLSRRKSAVTTQSEKSAGEGCKRCNCKKSKCLKLYCECFAAGVYCVGTCACRDCFNKPEYEETVSNTRSQIESRNPLAFAPKIVQAAESSPVPGDEAVDTPASARHKRGCNCKKSLCLKKYCECYQAGVGCSEGCRCEGCKNMYGRKQEGTEGEEKDGGQANSGREECEAEDPIELLNRMSGKSDRLRESAKASLSPITPTFEQDGHGRPALRLRSMGRKRGCSSDEHCASPLAEGASRAPTSPTRFSQTLDGFHPVAYAQGDTDFSMSAAGESPMTTPTFARMGHVSPRWEGLGDLCTLTPLPLAQLRPTPGSSCLTMERPGTSPAFSSHVTGSPYHGVSSTSVHQRAASRHWSPHDDSAGRFRQPAPRSPLRFDTPGQSQVSGDQSQSTPSMPQQASSQQQAVSGKKVESEVESAKVAGEDDGTPDFVRYGEESMGSPSRSTVTKSSSPKQKRVTPPRYGGNREAGSGGGVGSGSVPLARKFILQALPSAPSVAPSYPNG